MFCCGTGWLFFVLLIFSEMHLLSILAKLPALKLLQKWMKRMAHAFIDLAQRLKVTEYRNWGFKPMWHSAQRWQC
jgi:hypothetical protein